MSTAERTDYTSLVPQYSFSETLAEQESELQANPLLQRLLAYRGRYEGDPHRPIYHYVNPENRLNDPNGLCFWQGRWHLFYQAYPPEDPRQHWGHAVSDDLIHWRDLPYAIYPNPEECCFSGATLVEEERVIAIYHGTKVGNMVAVSHDPLLAQLGEADRRAGDSHRQRGRLAAALSGLRSLHLEERRALLCPLRRHAASRRVRQAHARQFSVPLAESGRLGLSAPVCGGRPLHGWWGTTVPAPISGRSETGTFCCSTAT